MLVLREERHEDLLVSVGRRQVDGRGAARGHPSPLLLLLSKLRQVAVLAVVEQVDESFGVTGGGRVVHGAQAAVVPQGGVGLVLCEIHTRRCVFRSKFQTMQPIMTLFFWHPSSIFIKAYPFSFICTKAALPD